LYIHLTVKGAFFVRPKHKRRGGKVPNQYHESRIGRRFLGKRVFQRRKEGGRGGGSLRTRRRGGSDQRTNLVRLKRRAPRRVVACAEREAGPALGEERHEPRAQAGAPRAKKGERNLCKRKSRPKRLGGTVVGGAGSCWKGMQEKKKKKKKSQRSGKKLL